MNKIKKKVKLITTINNENAIVADTTVRYNFKILLSANVNDFGFFDTLDQS